MLYVVATLFVAVGYLFYQNSIIIKEQNWQNEYLDMLEKDLRKLEILRRLETMNEFNVSLDNNDD